MSFKGTGLRQILSQKVFLNFGHQMNFVHLRLFRGRLLGAMLRLSAALEFPLRGHPVAALVSSHALLFVAFEAADLAAKRRDPVTSFQDRLMDRSWVGEGLLTDQRRRLQLAHHDLDIVVARLLANGVRDEVFVLQSHWYASLEEGRAESTGLGLFQVVEDDSRNVSESCGALLELLSFADGAAAACDACRLGGARSVAAFVDV